MKDQLYRIVLLSSDIYKLDVLKFFMQPEFTSCNNLKSDKSNSK